MSDCDPVCVDGEYVCKTCGWGQGKRLQQPFRRNCGHSVHGPSVRQKMASWCGAVHRWKEAGRPVRPISEVQRIYRDVCRSCEHIDANGRACTVCGCRVNTSKRAKLNKIRMAPEHCPIGKW